GDALVEFGVTLRRILKADGLCVHDLRDRQAVVQQRIHELPVIAEDRRLAGVEGIRLRPAEAQTKAQVAAFGGFVVRAGIFGDVQPRNADGTGRPNDLHRLIEHDGGLIPTRVALGFETHSVDDRIYCGFADDRGHLLAEAIVLGEVYRDEADLPGVAQSRLVH